MRPPAPIRPALDQCPWRNGKVALIWVPAGTGPVLYAKTIEEKRALLATRSSGQVLVAWPGPWSQDIFELDPADWPKVAAWLTSPRPRDEQPAPAEDRR